MKVIVYEETTTDISAAEKFGEIQFMFPPQSSRPSIWETEEFIEACSKQLDTMGFNPNEDMFVLAGPAVPLSIIINLLTRKYEGFRILLWHAHTRDYILRLMNGAKT